MVSARVVTVMIEGGVFAKRGLFRCGFLAETAMGSSVEGSVGGFAFVRTLGCGEMATSGGAVKVTSGAGCLGVDFIALLVARWHELGPANLPQFFLRASVSLQR